MKKNARCFEHNIRKRATFRWKVYLDWQKNGNYISCIYLHSSIFLMRLRIYFLCFLCEEIYSITTVHPKNSSKRYFNLQSRGCFYTSKITISPYSTKKFMNLNNLDTWYKRHGWTRKQRRNANHGAGLRNSYTYLSLAFSYFVDHLEDFNEFSYAKLFIYYIC